MRLVLAVEGYLTAVGRVVWWLAWPLRTLMCRRLNTVAGEYDDIARSMGELGLTQKAQTMRGLAVRYRCEAAGWRSPTPRWENRTEMIPKELVDEYLGVLFGNSEPGQTMHHMLVAVAESAAGSALGFLRADKLEVWMFAIAVVGPDRVEEFIAKTIADATEAARVQGKVPYFVGLTLERHLVVFADRDEVTENRARRMVADQQLHEHPEAVEVTQLYAASRDGRRWSGVHFLTGEQAGKMAGPFLREGPIAAEEDATPQRLVRAMVGLR